LQSIGLSREEAASTENALETRLAEAYSLYWDEQDYAGANAAFDAALKVAPNYARSVAGKGFLLRRLGKFEEAAEVLAKAHRLDPLNYSFKPELGLTYAIIGSFDSADTMIKRAKQQDPNSIYGALFEAAIEQFKGNPDAAWNAVSRAGDLFAKERLSYALPTGDRAKIRYALEAWPVETRRPENGPEIYAISEIMALEVLGELDEAKAKIEALRSRVEGMEVSVEWNSALPYRPLVIPALLGDVKSVERLAKRIEKVRPRDRQSELVFYGDAVDAFNRIGQPDTALDYIEKFIQLTGPHAILIFEDDPSLKGLMETPRFQKFQADYAAIK